MGEVVSIQHITEEIIQVTMQDREARNTFSEELVRGIIDAFDHIDKSHDCKVVVLTGYDNYFSCGGTKEELMAIYRGEIGFNDLQFFTRPLECRVPVISAMQGHGIGGGFVFGCYSDFIILGRENVYTTNFMKYGFTPGMGGTLLVPHRFGEAIGNEMLYTAENYRGAELKDRGVGQRVVPKTDVLPEAIRLAKTLAEKPRTSLVTLKDHLSRKLKEQLPTYIQQELQMHKVTFHTDEVRQRIESLF